MDSANPSREVMNHVTPVVVAGNNPVRITAETLGEHPLVSRTITIVCDTGSRHTAEWTGIPIDGLLDDAEVPPDTTHLLVTSADEYRVTIPIREAIDGILAFVKDGVPIGAKYAYPNRFVSPTLEGARECKGVAHIDHLAVPPEADPESFENLFPEGTTFSANRFEDEEALDAEHEGIE